MKKFILKNILFLTVFFSTIFILIIITSKIVSKRNFHLWETESILLPMHSDTTYNYIFIGNSHARNFSRHNNHKRVEQILNRSFYNLSKSGGVLGNNDYLFLLKYANSRGVQADTFIHNIFSQMLFAKYNNLASNTFENEPVRLDFFWQYVNYPYAQNKWQRLFYYLRSKIEIKWIFYKPFSIKSKDDYLTKIDTSAIQKGFKLAFRNNNDTSYFWQSAKITEELIKYIQNQGKTIIFITTPTLFGDWPKHEFILRFMKKMNEKYDVHYYDFANAIKDPKYFYDHHHLNTKGIILFTKKYLKPALQEGDTTFMVF